MVMVARKGMPNGVYWTQVRNLFFQLSIVELSIPDITFGPEVWMFSFPDGGLLKIEKDKKKIKFFVFVFVFLFYSLSQFKCHKSIYKKAAGEKFKKILILLPAFYMNMWVLESPKKFE